MEMREFGESISTADLIADGIDGRIHKEYGKRWLVSEMTAFIWEEMIMVFCWSTLMVKDLERSLGFYRDLLGLPVTRRFAAGPEREIVFLGDGETKIELVCHRVIGGKLEGSESSDFAAKGCSLLDGKRYGRAEDATDIQSVCKNNGVQVLSTFGEGEQCFCCPNLPFQSCIGCVGVQQHGAEPEQCRSGISIRGSIGIIKIIVMIGKADVGADSRELAVN